MINKNTNDIDQHHQDLMNKAAGSVISKYIFQIKKYKIDPTKPRQNPNKLFLQTQIMLLSVIDLQQVLKVYKVQLVLMEHTVNQVRI